MSSAFDYQTVVEDMLRCHLASLIRIADGKTPQGIKKGLTASEVSVGDLPKVVDAYSKFLRSVDSLK